MKAGWETRRLGEVVEILDRQRRPITKSKRTAGPYPYYGATGIVDYVAEYIFDEPLVLLGEDGAKWEAGERSGFAIDGRCWVNNHAHVLRPKRDQLTDDWLIYFLLASDLSEHVTGVTVPKLNQAKMRAIPLPVPSLAEQRRILEVLDEAFAALATATANTEQTLANARELASSFIGSLIERADAVGTSRRLVEVCDADWGNTDLTKRAYVEDGPFLAVSAAGCDGRIGHAEHEALVPVVSAIGARCGRMFLPTEPFTAIKNTMTVTPHDGVTDGKYLFYALGHHQLPRRGAAQPFIAKGDVDKFMIQVPSLDRQLEIVIEIEAVEEEVSAIEKNSTDKLTLLVELRQSLLTRAFAGELT